MGSSLTEITGLGPATKNSLEDEGITTIGDLAECDPEDIEDVVPGGSARDLIARARQRTLTTTTMADLSNEYGEQEMVTTGISALDDAMGGGLEPETICFAYGKSGMGKSQLAFSAMAAAASEGPVVYIQTEMTSKSIGDRIKAMVDDPSHLENIEVIPAFSVEDQESAYDYVDQEYDELVLLVVDSFTAQFRMTDEYQGRENLGDRSTDLGRHMNRVGELTRKFNCPSFLTGQVYPVPEAYGRSDEPWGGEKLRHFLSYFIRVSGGPGELKKATLENHPGRSEAEVLLSIQADGIEGEPA